MSRQLEIQNIVEKYDLASVAETDLGLKRYGTTNRYHCINKDQHRNGDANPSLVIYKEFFKCFGCGIKGDIFELLKLALSLDFKEALEYLGKEPQNQFRPLPKIAREKMQVSRTSSLSSDYLSFMKELWEILIETPLSENASAWLKSRGIKPDTAYKMGCRELSSEPLAIKRLLTHKYDPSSVGFASPDNKEKLWFPLKNINTHKGLLFPSWIANHDFPIQWRCRLYQPWNFDGRLTKSLAQYSKSKIIPLGLKKSNPDLSIICEGEPDFLSLYQVASDLLGISPTFNIIGICAIAQGWEPEWTSSLVSSQKIVIAVHDNHEGKTFAAKVARNIVKIKGLDFAKSNVFRMLFDENNDANDFHKNGKLNEWLLNLLIGIKL
jgi:hypothetical protein